MNNDRILTGIKAILMMLTAGGVELNNDLDSTATTITAGFLALYGITNAIRAFFKKPEPVK